MGIGNPYLRIHGAKLDTRAGEASSRAAAQNVQQMFNGLGKWAEAAEKAQQDKYNADALLARTNPNAGEVESGAIENMENTRKEIVNSAPVTSYANDTVNILNNAKGEAQNGINTTTDDIRTLDNTRQALEAERFGLTHNPDGTLKSYSAEQVAAVDTSLDDVNRQMQNKSEVVGKYADSYNTNSDYITKVNKYDTHTNSVVDPDGKITTVDTAWDMTTPEGRANVKKLQDSYNIPQENARAAILAKADEKTQEKIQTLNRQDAKDALQKERYRVEDSRYKNTVVDKYQKALNQYETAKAMGITDVKIPAKPAGLTDADVQGMSGIPDAVKTKEWEAKTQLMNKQGVAADLQIKIRKNTLREQKINQVIDSIGTADIPMTEEGKAMIVEYKALSEQEQQAIINGTDEDIKAVTDKKTTLLAKLEEKYLGTPSGKDAPVDPNSTLVDMSAYDKAHPNAKPEAREAYRDSVLQKRYYKMHPEEDTTGIVGGLNTVNSALTKVITSPYYATKSLVTDPVLSLFKPKSTKIDEKIKASLEKDKPTGYEAYKASMDKRRAEYKTEKERIVKKADKDIAKVINAKKTDEKHTVTKKSIVDTPKEELFSKTHKFYDDVIKDRGYATGTPEYQAVKRAEKKEIAAIKEKIFKRAETNKKQEIEDKKAIRELRAEIAKESRALKSKQLLAKEKQKGQIALEKLKSKLKILENKAKND